MAVPESGAGFRALSAADGGRRASLVARGRKAAGMSELPAGLQADFTRDSLAEDYAKALFDYWHAVCGPNALPPLSAIDPTRLPSSCLSYLSVLDVERDPLRLKSRLTGTALVEQLGMSQAGRYLDELPGTAAQLRRLAWCVQRQRPFVASSTLTFAPNDHKRYQAVVLPFGDAQAGVQRIVGAFCFLEGFDRATVWTR